MEDKGPVDFRFGLAMKPNQDELDDFENAFFYFVRALEVLGLPAEAQCEQMGNYNVSWELRHDASSGAMAITEMATGRLTAEQSDRVAGLISALADLPDEAIAPPGIRTDNHVGSLMAMRHASWDPVRREAVNLLALLESAILRNDRYFSGSALSADE